MILNSLLHLLFPENCNACNTFLVLNENKICTNCRNNLPLVNNELHTTESLATFFGDVAIAHFSSLFYFTKNSEVQELLHNLKYRNHKSLGKTIGDWHGHNLFKSEKFNDVDLVIPMPIHKKRLRKRGYNQVALYAKTIAEILQAAYSDDILIKIKHKKSQVFLNREDRFKNILDSLYVRNPEVLKNKHVLILDDVITTGATMRACASVLRNNTAKISIASIALVVNESL